MGTVRHLRPKLTAHRRFISDFIGADAPCFALGVVEELSEKVGFLGIRAGIAIPSDVLAAGFGFGHSLFGSDRFAAAHLAFNVAAFALGRRRRSRWPR